MEKPQNNPTPKPQGTPTEDRMGKVRRKYHKDKTVDYAVGKTLDGLSVYRPLFKRNVLRIALREAMNMEEDPDELRYLGELLGDIANDDLDAAMGKGIAGGDKDLAIVRLEMALREPECEALFVEGLANRVEERLSIWKDSEDDEEEDGDEDED